MKILVCEDNKLASRAVSAVLSKKGFDIINASDGNEAMELIEKEDFSLVIMDIHLPYYSGLELIRYMKTDLKKDIPVIIISAFSDPSVQKQSRELGISEYLVKPINTEFLLSRINAILKI